MFLFLFLFSSSPGAWEAGSIFRDPRPSQARRNPRAAVLSRAGAAARLRAPAPRDSMRGSRESPCFGRPDPVKARVHVTLKPGVLDPQGKAIHKALSGLGFAGVERVRQGKVIELELSESDPARARECLREMCEKLLANTVIENYAIELDG